MKKQKRIKKVTHPLSTFIDIIALTFLILAITASILPIPLGLIFFILGILIFGTRFRKVMYLLARVFFFEKTHIFKRLMKEEEIIEKKVIGQ